MQNLAFKGFEGPGGLHAVFDYRLGTADENTINATYKEDEYNFVNTRPASGDWMIDGGGYIGSTAILYAQLYPAAKILCIEPLPENVELIRKNIDANGLTDQIILLPKALLNTDGEKIEIYYRDESPVGIAHKYIGSSSRVYTESAGAKFYAAESISLKKIVEEYHIERIRLLKMDMECSEYKALENVPENILKKIQTIKGEYHNPDKSTIENPRTLLYQEVAHVFDDASEEIETQFVGSFRFERRP